MATVEQEVPYVRNVNINLRRTYRDTLTASYPAYPRRISMDAEGERTYENWLKMDSYMSVFCNGHGWNTFL